MMPARATIRITDYTFQRFRERIEMIPASDETIIVEMIRCLTTAKAKHLRKMDRETHYIPTDRCLFVCSFGAIVTVLPRKRS